MANSQTHFRSISLPSRIYPINPTNFETELQKLKCLQISAANSEAIQSGLLRIAELYNSVQEITQSSTTQKSVIVVEHHQDEKTMEESLSSSVELLDACSAIREVFQMMKENIQALQSALRRKSVADSSLQNDIATYFCCRKRMNKSIAKILKNLKKSEQSSLSVNNADSNFTSVFRELRGISMAIFKSILLFLSLTTARPRAAGGWSLVSKLMITKSGRENDDVNEVGNVDFSLSSLQKMRSNGARVLDVQKRLQNLDAIVEGFEGGLEILFRQLVQIRVTLLNILTDH